MTVQYSRPEDPNYENFVKLGANTKFNEKKMK